MTDLTDETMHAALSVIRNAGIPMIVTKKGSRVTVELERGGTKRRAVVKTASLGNAMVNADKDDADTARLAAIEHVDDVLFAVGRPNSENVETYIVPASIVEAAYRDTHRHWRAKHAGTNPNTTWVLPFAPTKDPVLGDFAKKWEGFRIGTTRRGESGPSGLSHNSGGPSQTGPGAGLTVDEAKSGLSIHYKVPTDKIKIVIEY